MSDASMVLRSVYLPTGLDEALRVTAFVERCSKSLVIRHFLREGLEGYINKRAQTKSPVLSHLLNNEYELMEKAAVQKDLDRLKDAVGTNW